MSLLSAAELLIKRYEDEQARINERIEAYREILESLTPQPRMSSEVSELADDAATGADPSPGEKEDIDLLERALQKALRVRTGSGPSKKHSGGNKLPGPRQELCISAATSVEVSHPSAAAKGSHPTTMKSALKPASLNRTQHRKPGLCSTLGPRPSACCNPGLSKGTRHKNLTHGRPSSSLSPGHMSASLPEHRPPAGDEERGDDLSRAASVSTPPENMEPLSHSVLQQNRRPSEQTATWKALRSKHSRLWDKIMVLQRKPAPGRSRFMERMRTLFPAEWPSGSPDQTRALLDTLTHRGHELTLLSPAVEAQPRQTTETESGGRDKNFDSCVTSQKFQKTTAELQTSAVKQEWKAWDRWRPEGGCLCPTGVSGVCGGGITAPLPLTVTYTTEAELQELEELRLKVALLQQEMHLEQVLLDSVSPQLVEPGGLNPRVLRDVYSLLAEGGQRFPAIVLDSE